MTPREQAYESIAPLVARAVAKRFSSDELIEDLIQEALVRVWEVLGEDRILQLPERKRLAYCWTAGMNAARDLHAVERRALTPPLQDQRRPMVRVTLRIPRDVYAAVCEDASEVGVSPSQYLRVAISRLVREE